MTEKWRRIQDEELHLLFTTCYAGDHPNRLRWAGHVASMGERKVAYICPKEGNHLENLGVDGKIILQWIFKESDVGMDSICPRRGTVSCKCDKEPPGSIENGEFFDQLRTY